MLRAIPLFIMQDFRCPRALLFGGSYYNFTFAHFLPPHAAIHAVRSFSVISSVTLADLELSSSRLSRISCLVIFFFLIRQYSSSSNSSFSASSKSTSISTLISTPFQSFPITSPKDTRYDTRRLPRRQV